MTNVVKLKKAHGWCAAGGKHRWLPCWPDGDYSEVGGLFLGRRTIGVSFFWCEVCHGRTAVTTGSEADRATAMQVWASARWAVYAESDGTARVVVSKEAIEAGGGALRLSEESAKRLAHALMLAGSKGRAAALSLTGQDRWSAEPADGALVLVTRTRVCGREGLYITESIVLPRTRARRCCRCETRLPPEGATGPTSVWRGTARQPRGMIWAPGSATESKSWMFCTACVEAMLGETEAIPLPLRGHVPEARS